MLQKPACCLLLLVLLGTLFGAAPGEAVTPYLVEDINPGSFNLGSEPHSFLTVAGLAYFLAEDGEAGRELWRSDGTAAGTFRLLDACDGPCSPRYDYLGAAGARLFFFVSNPDSIEIFGDLWVTGGSPDDTFRLAEGLTIHPDMRPVWVPELRLFFFVANDGEHGYELWRSDGTAAGTHLVKDIVPGLDTSSPAELTAFQGRLFFVAYDRVRGPSVWTSNGTPAGTRVFRDPAPGRRDHTAPVHLRVVGSRLLFFAPGGAPGFVLWRSDGTRPGTAPLFDLAPGPGEPAFVHAATAIGGRLYFIANTPRFGEELWASDGTARGTRRLTSHSDPFAFLNQQLQLPVPAPGNQAAFLMSDEAHGLEPWLTNGTRAGTRVIDVCPGACSSGAFLGLFHEKRLYFTADDGTHGREMWASDGSVAGTVLLRDVCPGECSSSPGPARAYALGSRVLFTAHPALGGGSRLYRTNGTPAGTVGIFSFPFSTELFHASPVPGALVFQGLDLEHGFELWRTDGTRGGTGLLKDLRGVEPAGSFPNQLTPVGDRIVFRARPDEQGFAEIWESDGTAEGTAPRGSLPPSCINELLFLEVLPGGDPLFSCEDFTGQSLWRGAPGEPVRLTPDHIVIRAFDTELFNGEVYFGALSNTAGLELWKTDGTPEGTGPVVEIVEGAFGGNPLGLTVFQGRLWFSGWSAASQAMELWSTDGTAAGTTLLLPAGILQHVNLLGVHLGRLWFAANSEAHGRELWSTDGTAAGTRVLDLAPGTPASSMVYRVASAGGRLFFSGGGDLKPVLWVSDGLASTHLLGGPRLRPEVDRPGLGKNTAVVGDRLFYLAFEDDSLWQSDGTGVGTRPVPGPDGEPIRGALDPTAFAGKLVFVWKDRLWETDGTAAGTVEIPDGFREPRELTVAGPRLFFRATDSVHGSELWALE